MPARRPLRGRMARFQVKARRSIPAGLRTVLGILLFCGGLLGFLPILGFWMIPVGLVILSYEFATVRRWRRRSEVWWAEKRGRRRARERQPFDEGDRR